MFKKFTLIMQNVSILIKKAVKQIFHFFRHIIIKFSLKFFFSGTAGDSLSYHRGSPFSTKDRDNDADSGNCASKFTGAWWYKSCYHSNLNGQYVNDKNDGKGMAWYYWKRNHNSVKRSEMKIRPKDF